MNHRESARSIFEAALKAAAPREAVSRAIIKIGNSLNVAGKTYDLLKINRLLVVGFGKASGTMAQAVEDILGDRIDDELILVKTGHQVPLTRGVCLEGTHPIPDEANLLATRRLVALLETACADDLVLCLISGGGSALLEEPAKGISLMDLQKVTEVLLRAGVSIQDFNVVRKHLSQVKGGQLVRHAGGARIISLILSDVVGSPLDRIASGPTAPDPSTYSNALDVVAKKQLRDQIPVSVKRYLEKGSKGVLPETPKEIDPLFHHVQNVIIADNVRACSAALEQAKNLGYGAHLVSSQMQGDVHDVARQFATLAREMRSSSTTKAPICLIGGGEPSVVVRGSGLGGRNQELVLRVAMELEGFSNFVFLSAGTDGTDGPTDAAGAIADERTLARAETLGLVAARFLGNNDSYHFFRPLNDLVVTGPTGTNVNDLMILIVD